MTRFERVLLTLLIAALVIAIWMFMRITNSDVCPALTSSTQTTTSHLKGN